MLPALGGTTLRGLQNCSKFNTKQLQHIQQQFAVRKLNINIIDFQKKSFEILNVKNEN